MLGKRIRKLRRASDITQKELGRRVNISRPYLARVEAGNSIPSVYVLARIAAELNTTVDDLIAEEAVNESGCD